MSAKSLFLAWQDTKASRLWFPVGQLDADVEQSDYRFRYTGGAERAQEEAGFPPTFEFPDFQEDYHSSELFPIFQNRVIAHGRPDRLEYLSNLDLPENADPVMILSVNGGNRVTDTFEVFPKIEKHPDGSFCCRFFLHGLRHLNSTAQERINRLNPDEKLYVTLELTNPATALAVQLQTLDYHMIGWAPRYLVYDLTTAMADAHENYTARVVRLNPLPTPSNQRLLVELSGRWNEHEPMSGRDFQPLVS